MKKLNLILLAIVLSVAAQARPFSFSEPLWLSMLTHRTNSSNTTLGNGLLGYYDFVDGGTSSHAAMPTLSGVNADGWQIFFDGTNIVNVGGFSVNSSFTVSAWIFNNSVIYDCFPFGVDDGSGNYIALHYNLSGQIRENSPLGDSSQPSGAVNNGWHMWTLVCDTSSSTAQLYIDASLAISDITFTGTFNNLTLGGNYYGGGLRTTSCYINKVGVWNRALTQSEVSLLYNSYQGLTYSQF